MATFTQRDLGIAHAAAGSSNVELVRRVSHSAPCGHQLVDQLLPEVFRDVRIGGPPASTVDDDEGVLRGRDRLHPSTLKGQHTAPAADVDSGGNEI